MKIFSIISLAISCASAQALWRYDPSVTQVQRNKLDQAFNDVRTLAAAAANQAALGAAAGPQGGIWHRYYPQNADLVARINAMWHTMAGIPIVYPPAGVPNSKTLTDMDWQSVTLSVASTALHVNEAKTTYDPGADTCTIRMHPRGYNAPLLSQVNRGDIRNSATATMETIGAIIIHELLHCHQLIKPTIGRNSVTGQRYAPALDRRIDDQPTFNPNIYMGKSYGSYPSQQLKQNNPVDSMYNNDSNMYFALESYWGATLPRTFNPTTRDEYKRDCPRRLNFYQTTGCNVM